MRIIITTVIIGLTVWCGCSQDKSPESFTPPVPETCNEPCEAPAGYNCWYVSTRGDDTNPGTCDEPFGSIQYAVDTMESGDIVYVRGGTYYESEIQIDTDKNGECSPVSCMAANCSPVDCTGGSWSTIKSYPGEWAVLNARHRGQYVIGNHISGAGDHNQYSSYWKFERLEITGGGDSRDEGYGISISGGPFIVRGCYIHDNYGSDLDENSGGVRGYGWHDSLIEFNYFYNNGYGGVGNTGDIVLFADYRYDHDYSVDHGGEACFVGGNDYFFDADACNWPVARNEIRYNYFNHSDVAIKHKAVQMFSTRNSSLGWDDTYISWGDKIHHNIIINTRKVGIYVNQDFARIYNNIVDIPSGDAIGMPHNFKTQNYKVITYNNTIINSDSSGRHLNRGRARDFTEYSFMPVYEHFGWDFNNIFVGSSRNTDYCGSATLTIVSSNSATSCDAPHDGSLVYDVSGYFNDCNYFYCPTLSALIKMQDIEYTAEEFEAQALTGNNPNVYSNLPDPENELFEGTSGAGQYVTRGAHLVDGSLTIENGGVDIAHPFIAGEVIPAYIGATNPDNNDWVEGVMSLTGTDALRNLSDDPDWVE